MTNISYKIEIAEGGLNNATRPIIRAISIAEALDIEGSIKVVITEYDAVTDCRVDVPIYAHKNSNSLDLIDLYKAKREIEILKKAQNCDNPSTNI